LGVTLTVILHKPAFVALRDFPTTLQTDLDRDETTSAIVALAGTDKRNVFAMLAAVRFFETRKVRD
jgi:hypothetical protein